MAYIRIRRKVLERGPIKVIWTLPLGECLPLTIERRVGGGLFVREVGRHGPLDVHEAAVALNCADRTTVYRLIREGRLSAVSRHGSILIPRSSIEDYLIEAEQQRRGRKLGQGWRR